MIGLFKCPIIVVQQEHFVIRHSQINDLAVSKYNYENVFLTLVKDAYDISVAYHRI